MRPCSRIYYSNVAQRISSDTPLIIRSSQTVKPEAAMTVFELLMMSGVSLETRRAFKKRNNKFYYTVASCWLFL
jgi:hypothetical protein